MAVTDEDAVSVDFEICCIVLLLASVAVHINI